MASLHLNDNSIAMLADIGEHGVLDTKMVHRRHCAEHTLRRTQQILADLADHGFTLTTTLTVTDVMQRNGRTKRVTRRVPAIHALLPKGADAVERAWGERPRRVLHGEPAPETLLHRRAVVETRLAFDASCGAAGLAPPDWIHESDIRPNAPKEMPPNQRCRLHHVYEIDGQRVACRLDAACRVFVPRPPAQEQGPPSIIIIGWEIDLSTEGRKQLRRTKPAALAAWLAKRSFQEYWPEIASRSCHVRIAWVVPTPKRIPAILDMSQHEQLRNAYRFLTKADHAKQLATEPVWRTAEGEFRQMCNPPAAVTT